MVSGVGAVMTDEQFEELAALLEDRFPGEKKTIRPALLLLLRWMPELAERKPS